MSLTILLPYSEVTWFSNFEIVSSKSSTCVYSIALSSSSKLTVVEKLCDSRLPSCWRSDIISRDFSLCSLLPKSSDLSLISLLPKSSTFFLFLKLSLNNFLGSSILLTRSILVSSNIRELLLSSLFPTPSTYDLCPIFLSKSFSRVSIVCCVILLSGSQISVVEEPVVVIPSSDDQL